MRSLRGLLVAPVLPVLLMLAGAAPAQSVDRPDWQGSRHAMPADYAWLDAMTPTDCYTIVVVRGLSVRAVLRKLGGVERELPDQDPAEAETFVLDHMDEGTYAAPRVAQVERRGRAVVVYAPYGVIDDAAMAPLSRAGVAVQFGTDVEYDTYVTVGRRGRVVRQFDAGFKPPAAGALPAEKGLDWGERHQNVWATAWAFMERLTRTHLSEEWFGSDHPTFVLERGAML